MKTKHPHLKVVVTEDVQDPRVLALALHTQSDRLTRLETTASILAGVVFTMLKILPQPDEQTRKDIVETLSDFMTEVQNEREAVEKAYEEYEAQQN